MSFNFRIGQGYDVHAFGAGDHVMLGGVRVAHSHGVLAHSDGDVVLHALCDAMLGALALGDIGQHFPPTARSSCSIAITCCASVAGGSAMPMSP
jgi:2-C-methyl-D-erythritol 2,4-cyclodiphosphate synthase